MNRFELAIVALELQLPGAESLLEFSDLIYSGRSSVTLSPAARDIPTSSYTHCLRKGSFLTDIYTFDYEAFNLTKEEAIFLDPQQRIMMEVASKALDQAGMSSQKNRDNVGVFIGGRMNSYGFEFSQNNYSKEKYSTTVQEASAPLWGRSQNFLAAWISDRFNLSGPSLVIDTACSSSLSALWVAVQAIMGGNCEAALVGGIDLLIDSLTFDLLEGAGALSKSGYCRPLDQRADGYLPGEGAVALVLKPIEIAQRDGDEILAQLIQIQSNNDGLTMGVTTPNVIAQQELIKKTYLSGIGSQLEYVELHGTGTAIGDPIEIDALNRGLLAAHTPKHTIDIGSIKQQIGHLHSASGLAGLAKIVVIAQNRLIPVSLVSEPNPRLKLDKTYFRLTDQVRELTKEKVCLAISSFGFGGTNVHAVIEPPVKVQMPNREDLPFILPLSAPSSSQLRDLVAQWIERLSKAQPIDIVRMCAAAGRRKHWKHRLAVTADNHVDLISLLKKYLFLEKLPYVEQPYFVRLNATPNGKTIQSLKYLEEIDSNIHILVDELTELTGVHLNQLTNDLLSFAELCLQAKLLTDLGISIDNLIFPLGCRDIGKFIIGRISLIEALNAVVTYECTDKERREESKEYCVDMAYIVSTSKSADDMRSKLAKIACIAYEVGETINWECFYNNKWRSLLIPHYPLDGMTLDLPEQSRRGAREMNIKVTSYESNILIEATLCAQHDLIAQHLVYGVNILPGVAWFGIMHDMLAEAGMGYSALENIRFLSPLIPVPTIKIICSVEPSGKVTISNAFNKQQYFSANIINDIEPPPEPFILHKKFDTVKDCCSGTSTYRWLRRQGYSHGRYYRNISFIASIGENQTIARLESNRCSGELYSLNPGLLDAMTISAIDPNKILNSSSEIVVIPFSIESVQFYLSLKEVAFVYTTISSYNNQGYRTTQSLLTEEGEIVAVFTNLASKSISLEQLEQAISKTTFKDKRIQMKDNEEADFILQNMEELDNKNYNSKGEKVIKMQKALETSTPIKTLECYDEYLLQFLKQANLSIEDVDLEFLEAGLDSKDLVELSDRLASEWSLPLYPTIFFEFPTPRSFVEGFLKKYPSNQLLNDSKRELIQYSKNDLSSRNKSDIAIIGLSLCLPGANNKDEYWNLLLHGEMKANLISEKRCGWEDSTRKIAVGAYIEDIEMFDPSIFRISPREAASIDPQARILYERIWEALESAGIDPVGESTGKTGLWIAYSHDHYYEERIRCGISEKRGLGLYAMIANRLSYALDWHGPSQTVNTLCSSSLVAIHDAVEALRREEVEVAVVGAVNLGISSNYYKSMCEMGVFSTNGRCRAFDALANGTIPGEGAICIVLRRCDKAIERNDPILALIKGTAVGHGGLSTRYSAPNPNAQATVIADALSDARMGVDKLGLIEAHGTGTALGDPIEIEGLKKAWGSFEKQQQVCGIGSVKSNIGHLEAAAGLAGVAKVILAIQNKILPPTIGVSRPNNHIEFENSPFFLVDRPAPWPKDRPLAGISAFGMGGVNAHVVLAPPPEKTNVMGVQSKAFICTVSAATEAAVRRLAKLYADALEGLSARQAADFCFTANTSRTNFKYRIAVGGSLEKIKSDLRSIEYEKEIKPMHYIRGKTPSTHKYADIKEPLIQMNSEKAEALAEQYNKGYIIEWKRLYNGDENRLISIPTYPFERQAYWLDELTNSI